MQMPLRYARAMVAVSRWLDPWTRNRLFRKYVVPFVAVVSGALLTNGLVEIYFTYQESRAQLAQIQREKASAAALQIEQFVREIERQMGWTTQPQVVAAPGALEQRQIDYVRLLRQVPAITEVAFLDGRGREQLRISRLAMDVVAGGADVSGEPRFRETRGGRVWYGPVYFRKESEPYMTLAVPHGTSVTAPVTAAEVNLKFIWDVVSQIRVGRLGQAYVVDRQGHLLAHPDISLVLRKTDFSTQTHVRAARDGATDAMLSTDLAGRNTLVAHTVIAPLGWTVFVEQPLTEAFAPLRGAILRTGLLMLLGVFVAVIASLALARKIGRPIEALRAGAARIGGGDLAHRIDVRTRDELQDLGEQFNRMAGALQESYATLEHKVEDRTRDLSEALEQQTATSEILRVISGSPTDIQPVFEAIVRSAVRLCGGLFAIAFRFDGDELTPVAHHGFTTEALEMIGRVYPSPPHPETMAGRAVLERRTIHIPDVSAHGTSERSRELALAIGYRAFLAVPMLRDGVAIGVINITRREAEPFAERQIEVMKVFAAQAVIAIENVRLFNEIQDKSRQLEAANRHKDEFLASMSHELRTPLNAVIGFSEVLIEKMFGDVNAKQEEYLHDILASGRHLLSLINDILDLAKIEAGRMDLDLEDFDVAQAIDNAVVLIRERATRKGLTLDTRLDRELGSLRGDQRKIKQVLLNLLSNAVKFTPEGGRVEVRAQRLDGQVEVSVADTGTGIAAQDLEAVFEEFRQVGTDYAKKHEGTGLGLTLSRKFVELHGGRIWVKSQLGHGSTFAFTLPVGPWPAS